MPKHSFDLIAITQTFDDGAILAEGLFFPEVSCYGDNADRLHRAIRHNAKIITEGLDPVDLHKRHVGETPRVEEVTIEVKPPEQGAAWCEPIPLTFHVLRWVHDPKAHVAFVPALGIEVLAESEEGLDRLIPEHIRFALLRRGSTKSLEQLIHLRRCRSLRVDRLEFTAAVHTPKEIAMEEGEEKPKESVLKKVATRLLSHRMPESFEIDELVGRMAKALVGDDPRSLLLVGPSGVGKTVAVKELVRKQESLGLTHTPFWETSGSRLVAGMSGFGTWQERCLELWREVSKTKAILHVGNLVELMEVGKGESTHQGIAGFLGRYVARGDMLVIAECTPEQLPVVEREEPRLLQAFHQIEVAEPPPEKGMSILLGCAISRKHHSRSPRAKIDIDAIETVDRLHRRYATYSAYPGRPLRFLDNLLRSGDEEREATPEEVTAAFSRETGLPLFMLDDSIPLDLAQTRDWFMGRVMGQEEAVGLVVDLIATVKAGLSRPRKPLASLLFIGPTGVGKTEMAKALAEFMFGDKTRMTRFDMSEYSDAISVRRLVGGVFGNEGRLTAKVREQPFAVVLLDEFEKAHHSFFDLLLQVLGEGRLTDASGRTADFCNSIVIMTSNLGAEAFQQGSLGFVETASDRDRARDHFAHEVKQFLRPETYNRIDRIVPFAPLDRATVRKIADRELELVRGRAGISLRDVDLRMPVGVVELLAEKGFDPKYGARPLKRLIERELLVPLADGMNRYSGELALSADVRAVDGAIRVGVRARDDGTGKGERRTLGDSGDRKAASDAMAFRRKVQRLDRSPGVNVLRNNLYRLARLEDRKKKRGRLSAQGQKQLGRLAEMQEIDEAIKHLVDTTVAIEDEALFGLIREGRLDSEVIQRRVTAAKRELDRVLHALFALEFEQPDEVTLAVYGGQPYWLFSLSEAYYLFATEGGRRAVVCCFVRCSGKGKGGPPLVGTRVRDPKRFLAEPRPDVIGVGMRITGPLVFPRFVNEEGLHVLHEGKEKFQCLVHTSPDSLQKYSPPSGIELHGAIGKQEQRRAYDDHRARVDDKLLGRQLAWHGSLVAMMRQAIEEHLRRQVEAQIPE